MDTWDITVDGQRFVVRRNPAGRGVYDFDWRDGPDGYGFSSGVYGDGDLTLDDLRACARDFLAEIDPATGYMRD